MRTDRLVLRSHRPDDEDALLRACRDPGTQRWITALPVPNTAAHAREWVRDTAPRERAEGRGMPAVGEADGELVGSAGRAVLSGRLTGG